MRVGQRLRQERLRRHLSQEALAEALDISTRSIRRWEQDQALPHASMRLLLSRFFEVSPAAFFAEQEECPLPTHLWTVPYLRNPFFTGRDLLLQHLHTLLFPTHDLAQAHAIALSGLGGIGKTQTAAEYAYRHAREYTAIFWLHAETAEHMRSDVIALANRLDLPARELQDQRRIVSAVHRWFVDHQGWLLIVDNVQEIEAIKELLPVACHGSLLFTTRLPTLGTLARILCLQRMTAEEGLQFLLRRTDQTRHSLPAHSLVDSVAAPEYVAAERIVALMEGLPLALDQAGAYIANMQSGLADFLYMFQRHPMRILQAREISDEHPLSVARTFLLAFQQVQQTNPLAADLLTVCAMLPLDGVPEELVTEAYRYLGPSFAALRNGTQRYHQALQDLLSYSFVRRLPAERCLLLHPLVQLVIREQLEAPVQQQWAVRLLQATNALFPCWEHMIFPEDNVEDWPRNQRLLPLVFACTQLIEQYQIFLAEALHLLARAAHYLRLRAQYDQAEILCGRAMRLNEAMHGSMQSETALILFIHVPLYYDLGRYEEARAFCQRALALYEQTQGSEHAVTIAAANFLAELSRLCGKDQEAETLFLRVLAFYEHQGKGAEIASPLFSLANLYRTQKCFEKAELLFQRALAVREQELGNEHFHTAGSLRGLALLYTECKRYAEAECLYLRALSIYEQTLGPEHPHVAITLMHLGQHYVARRRYCQAEAFFQRSLALQERIYTPEHTHFISLLTQLGQLATARQRYEEAEAHLRRALTLVEHAPVPAQAQIAEIRSELCRLHMQQQVLSAPDAAPGETSPQEPES